MSQHSNPSVNPPKLRPLGCRVLVRLDGKREMTAGGLHIPQVAQEQPVLGTVVAVGPGWTDADGVYWGHGLEPGDRVAMGKYNGRHIESDDGHEYRLCDQYKYSHVKSKLRRADGSPMQPDDYQDIYFAFRDEPCKSA